MPRSLRFMKGQTRCYSLLLQTLFYNNNWKLGIECSQVIRNKGVQMEKRLVDIRDVRFVLFEQLEIEKLLSPDLKDDYDIETLEMVIKEAEKLALNALAPANKDGDRTRCRFEHSKVFLPSSFHKAYAAISEGGWNVIADPREFGGQGLPKAIEICCREFFEAANISFSNYINLTHGAGKLIEIFGTPEQKEIFLDKMYSGTWSGTMCLTEPAAGTDVGAIKTIAKKNSDGTYSIKGTKSFITAGEHDLVENIVHMVLARIEGDPPGTKGLSVFIVPKMIGKDGNVGEPNDVLCTGIEEKMGCHGSSTCTLNFGDNDNCTGYLLGQERQGIAVMFHMMNEARQLVGSQGLAAGSSAYLESLSYARERIQGVHFTQMKNPEAPRVPIIEHPDIRYKLMRMKTYVEGCRALIYYHAHLMDRVQLASSEEEKAKWQGIIELLTPVCKAYSSDRGFEICASAIQILGGYGYSSEFSVEQYLRDEIITSIYEGTNGIQAIDLASRKIRMKKGQVFNTFLDEINSTIDQARSRQDLSYDAGLMENYRSALREGTRYLVNEMGSDCVGIAMAKAGKFLEFFGDVTLAWLWLWQLLVSEEKLDAILREKSLSREDLKVNSPQDNELAFYCGKIQTGKFYLERMMPSVYGKLEEIRSEGVNFLKISVASL
ncbi:MAG TPA: acyl-CoA dehydrogenase [Deltaproteobacteria bacterium]|nr:acyl-CoA dehydrogenase [Deltaproteobacteria bacterium]